MTGTITDSGTLANANIFFLITSISVVILTILLVITIIYVVIIMGNIRHITHRVRDETDLWANELAVLRAKLATERFGFRTIIKFIKKLISY